MSHILAAHGSYESPISSCMRLFERGIEKTIALAEAARRDRLALREAARLSGPRERITQTVGVSSFGSGICHVRKGHRGIATLTPDALAIIREYALTPNPKQQPHPGRRRICAEKAGVSQATVKKYARLIREGKL